MSFDKGFLWGVACAAYQCEGAWDADGKGPSIWDEFSHTKGNVRNGDTGDVACDTYRLYKEDIALMKQLGVQVYRFSISWPRIIPNGTGAINEAGLQYYDDLIDTLLENGIAPWVTLYHWDLPSPLQAAGGWTNRATVDAIREYAAVLAKRFNGRVTNYMTINEPQCVVGLGYGNGQHAPGLKLSKEEQALCMHHLVLAHGVGTTALRENSSGPIQVGLAPCGRLCYPEQDTPAGREAAYRASFRLTEEDWTFTFNIFMDSIMFHRYDDDVPAFLKTFEKDIPQSDWDLIEKPDFLGVNVYGGIAVTETGEPVGHIPGFPLTATKWKVTPEVRRFGMLNLYRRYGLPIYITENGQSCNDRVFLDGKVHDPDRIDFLNRYLAELKKAAQEGVPVRGYFHWSFLDNFEWNDGYDERFGIVYVDYTTQHRILKDSAIWYAGVIASNAQML